MPAKTILQTSSPADPAAASVRPPAFSLRPRVTISDVARRCGVSITTVSQALNLTAKESRVAEATRRHVMQVSTELGYRPDWRARALRRSATNMIGLLYARAVPFMFGQSATMIRAVAEALQVRGYALQFIPLIGEPAQWEHMLLDQRMDGFILANQVDAAVAEMLTTARLPAVVLNAIAPPGVSQVNSDDFGAAVTLTNHLIALGHRRIAFVHPDASIEPRPATVSVPHYSVADRIDGYLSAMRDAGLSESVTLIPTSVVVTEPLDAVAHRTQTMPDRPTAVIAYDDKLAVRLVRAYHIRGVRMPDELSIAAFNDVYPMETLYPSLTVMALQTEEMGQRVTDLLLARINSADAEPQQVTLPEVLVLRESTRPPATA